MANDTPDIQVASEMSTCSDDARKCVDELDVYNTNLSAGVYLSPFFGFAL
jgi:hypothetical protein